MRYPLQTLENPSILQFITGKNVFSIREKTPCFQKISGFSEEKKDRWFSKNTCFQKTRGFQRTRVFKRPRGF